MEVGTYCDGRPLTYDQASTQFHVGGVAVTLAQVLEYDEWDQLTWVSAEMKIWAQGLRQFPTTVSTPSATNTSTVVQATPAATTAGWFTRLPLWAKVLFVLVWPVSVCYGVYWMWKDQRFSRGARLALTAAAGLLFVIAAASSGHNASVATSSLAQKPVTRSGSVAPQQATEAATEIPPDPAPEPAPDPEPVVALLPASVVRVVDGDTAVFVLENGQEEKVRFIGIDTPESTTQIDVYGKEASSYTSKVLSVGRQVWLEKDVEERDRYGRMLAYIWLSEPSALSDAEIRAKMFNAHLALDGYAQQMTIQPNSKYADYFTTYVAEARTADKGLWNPALVAAPKPAPKAKVAAPSPTPSASYIGNKSSKKFHYADCSSVGAMSPSNKVPLNSRDQAISLGYVPCKRCNP